MPIRTSASSAWTSRTAGACKIFATEGFQRMVLLAAQDGLCYSLTNPHVCAQTNLVGFANVL
jgi:hypothetical protein